MSKKKVFCKHCGTELPSNVSVCPECKKKVGTSIVKIVLIAAAALLIPIILILAIMGAIAIPKFNSVRDKAYQASCRGNMQQLATCQGMHLADKNRYGTLAEISIYAGKNATTCPQCKQPYIVRYSGGNTYIITCPAKKSHGSYSDDGSNW